MAVAYASAWLLGGFAARQGGLLATKRFHKTEPPKPVACAFFSGVCLNQKRSS